MFRKSLNILFERGLPNISVPLPSRNELCQFTLRPISDNVLNLCENLKLEDKGIDFVAVYNRDGIRIANSTPIQHLLQLRTFSIRINDTYYNVEVPPILSDEEERIESSERLTSLDDVKLKIAALYSALQIDEFKLSREQLLISKLEEVEIQLKPLDAIRLEIERECEIRSSYVAWGLFMAMGIQTGILFRLTYFEYSWDVVEPLSYFATYSTGLAALGYYLVTRQSFDYPTASERVYSKEFYKRAAKRGFDVKLYNQLSRLKDSLKHDLDRLRDPLSQHLPATRLASLESELAKMYLTNIPKFQPKKKQN
uniref:Calcium uniporter protein n=1 Tax=Panagrolaimus sp. ES5 TaxID=591445 RepID=A0AC34GSA4_9BILA